MKREVKEEAARPETSLGSVLSSPFPLTGRAKHGLGGQEEFLSGTAASPEPKGYRGSPNKAKGTQREQVGTKSDTLLKSLNGSPFNVHFNLTVNNNYFKILALQEIL